MLISQHSLAPLAEMIQICFGQIFQLKMDNYHSSREVSASGGRHAEEEANDQRLFWSLVFGVMVIQVERIKPKTFTQRPKTKD